MWHFNYFARNTLLVVKLGKFKHHICENNYLFTNNYLLLSISNTTTQVRTSSQYTIEHACHLKPAHAHYNQIATAHASMTSPKHTTAHARNNVQYVLDLIQYVIALQAAARTLSFSGQWKSCCLVASSRASVRRQLDFQLYAPCSFCSIKCKSRFRDYLLI